MSEGNEGILLPAAAGHETETRAPLGCTGGAGVISCTLSLGGCLLSSCDGLSGGEFRCLALELADALVLSRQLARRNVIRQLKSLPVSKALEG